jgi:hypothetical protein
MAVRTGAAPRGVVAFRVGSHNLTRDRVSACSATPARHPKRTLVGEPGYGSLS